MKGFKSSKTLNHEYIVLNMDKTYSCRQFPMKQTTFLLKTLKAKPIHHYFQSIQIIRLEYKCTFEMFKLSALLIKISLQIFVSYQQTFNLIFLFKCTFSMI